MRIQNDGLDDLPARGSRGKSRFVFETHDHKGFRSGARAHEPPSFVVAIDVISSFETSQFRPSPLSSAIHPSAADHFLLITLANGTPYSRTWTGTMWSAWTAF